MKKQLPLLMMLMLSIACFNIQTTHAQTGFALSLPGGANGANSNMAIPALGSKITGFPFTVEMWIKPSSWVAYGGFWVDRSASQVSGNNATTMQFDNNATNHYIRCDYNGNARLIPAATLTNAICNNGQWNHIAYTVWADSARLELNGVYYTVTYATKTWNPNFSSGISYIGWDNAIASRVVTGLYDDIRFWNTARTRDEIEANKNVTLTGNEPGLVAYYNFDDKTAHDKTANGFNAIISGGVLTDPNAPVISLSENNLVIEIEKDLQPYTLYISASNPAYTINAIPSTGFAVDKSSFTPADFTTGGGKVPVVIYPTTAMVGDTGKVVISYTMNGLNYNLDSVKITPVNTYERYIIKHKASGLVLGNDSILSVPALTNYIADYTQYYILRPVNPGIADSLFYIEQDGEYRMLRKGANDWDTEFGGSSLEAEWKVIPQANGTSMIQSVYTQRALGATALTINTRLTDNNTFTPNPTSSPYCEWLIQSLSSISNPAESRLLSVTLSQGILNHNFNPDSLTYNVLAPADADNIILTGTAQTNVAFINNNGGTLSPASSPLVLSCISGDNSSTTNYSFNYTRLGFNDWAAHGETNASRSVPSQWGWKCPNAVWNAANSTTPGTVRYIDKPAGYYTYGDTLHTGSMTDSLVYKGRIMYVRWDGNVTTGGVYSYPTMLDAGKNYVLTGKYAWNSVIPSGVTSATLSFGINSAADNTGTFTANADSIVQSTDLLHLHPFTLTFTPATSGLYYFTVQCNAAILAALSDLNLSDGITAVSNISSNHLFLTVSGKNVQIHGTRYGDNIKVYSMNGQEIKQLRATSDIPTIELNSGVYLIKVNDTTLKIVR